MQGIVVVEVVHGPDRHIVVVEMDVSVVQLPALNGWLLLHGLSTLKLTGIETHWPAMLHTVTVALCDTLELAAIFC